MASQTLTSGQVARILDIPARTIRSYLATGRLLAEQNPVTGRWTITRKALAEFMRSHGLDAGRLERPLRIIIIDSDPNVANLYRSLLPKEGRAFLVEAFVNCPSALISMGNRPPDILIVDQTTAGDHCLEIMEAVRNHQRTTGVRILLITKGSGDASESLAHALLQKPIESNRLRPALSRLMGRIPA